MLVHTGSRIEAEAFKEANQTALLSMRDPGTEPIAKEFRMRLDLEFHDIAEPLPNLVCPTMGTAMRILSFVQQVREQKLNIMCQCEAGVGRSQSVAAFLVPRQTNAILEKGSYNRLLYRLLLQAADCPIPEDPLVSIVCRIKYPMDRALAMCLCMQRQRYTNWELILVTDGPEDATISLPPDRRVRFILTDETKGLWGHPYRQLGIDAAKGDYIGLTNDDNYYVPGYIEQMVFALQKHKAELAICHHLHSYMGWQVCAPTVAGVACDLGCFLASKRLMKEVKWPGNKFTSDGEFIALLAAKTPHTVFVPKPLFVHN